MIRASDIKAIREQQGMSIEKLAAKAGLSRDYVWKIESKKAVNVGIEKLSKIAGALGVLLKDLIDE